MIRIREAAVAGSFYPADAQALGATVRFMLETAGSAAGDAPSAHPVALVVPHAGHVYSGPVAAAAYARLLPFRADLDCILLLGPSHQVPLQGLAASSAQCFRTPLGDVPVDHDVLGSLQAVGVGVDDAAHAPEHSLEVQLPFLQRVLDRFRLIPLLAGRVDASAVAAVIEGFWRRPGRLVVVSTDLSHYLGYADARRVDRRTCQAIESMDAEAIGHDQACGAVVLQGLLQAAAGANLSSVTLDLRNSGDMAGGRDRVVGYGAWMFTDKTPCRQAA